MKLSIVTTLYKSESYVIEFHSRISKVAAKLAGDDFEIILVNDGSLDASLEIAVSLTKNDSRTIVIDLSRNFGQHKAMMAGLEYSRGEQVFLIDSDLEESPEWLIEFSEQMIRDSCDVVYGVQVERKGDLFERWSGTLFYKFYNILTGLSLPANLVTARLMTRRYVDGLLLYTEREIFMAGLWYITGFDQRPCTVTKKDTSKTTYTFKMKMMLLINSVTSFSDVPLVFVFYTGFFILSISVIGISYLVLNWMLNGKVVNGWTSMIASVWLLGGMIISFIGIVGIYIAKVFSECKRRPNSIIRKVYAK